MVLSAAAFKALITGFCDLSSRVESSPEDEICLRTTYFTSEGLGLCDT